MTEDIRVVAHFADGRVFAGTTTDFMTDRPVFHLRVNESGDVIEVHSTELKALFFVRDLKGRPQRKNIRGFVAAPGTTSHGKKVVVRFRDGEVLCGYSHTYTKESEGFFLFPADTSSNNLRIFVVLASTSEVKQGPEADTYARTLLRKRSA